MRLGYSLSSEEHGPNDLVEHARLAEEAGFEYGFISDHFHPWVDAQGQSPFVWSVIGGIARVTERFSLGTGVTCPTIRVHPAIVAQAAATCAAMMPGRFWLGLGTGENLNEHVLGDRWPAEDERVEMLEEAIDVIRTLWEGDYVTRRGRFYTVDRARIYTLPEERPPIHVAAGAPRIAEIAGRVGDGLVNTSPDEEVVRAFERGGGEDKPRYAQIHVCWHESAEEARRLARELWPTSAFEGPLNQELATPAHFEAVAAMVDDDDVARSIPCGPDAEPVLARIRTFEEAGFDHVYLHQVGPDQEGFLRFAQRELLVAATG